jgi:hypothetical protein
MTAHLARLLAVGLLFAVVACGGCAERPQASPETAGDRPAAAAAPEPAPAPTPVPIPVALACQADSACVASPYPRPVSGPGDCYCPECPRPLAAGAAVEHEQAWSRFCGAGWAERAGCRAPMCPRPAAVGCREGACVFTGGS